MQIRESVVVDAPRERVWTFFDRELERVARCMPGVEAVQPLGGDRYRARMKQKLGFLAAVFDLVVEVQHKEPPRALEFSGSGRAVRGPSAEVRATNRVELDEVEAGRTRITVSADMQVSGMLGALGPTFIEKRVRQSNAEFARALSGEIRQWATENPAPGRAGTSPALTDGHGQATAG
jgi:carbon monoxide dehydrogenase subunit G